MDWYFEKGLPVFISANHNNQSKVYCVFILFFTIWSVLLDINNEHHSSLPQNTIVYLSYTLNPIRKGVGLTATLNSRLEQKY